MSIMLSPLKGYFYSSNIKLNKTLSNYNWVSKPACCAFQWDFPILRSTRFLVSPAFSCSNTNGMSLVATDGFSSPACVSTCVVCHLMLPMAYSVCLFCLFFCWDSRLVCTTIFAEPVTLDFDIDNLQKVPRFNKYEWKKFKLRIFYQ